MVADSLKTTNTPPTPRLNSQPAGGQDVCGVLCDILTNGVDVHRTLAAQALGKIGGTQAVDTLIKGLLDEDEDVRTDCATGLARLTDPRADEQLLENLIGDPCPEVKLAAMGALTGTRNKNISAWLLRIMAGRDEEIAWDEDEFYATGWDDWIDMQQKAIESLGDLGVEEAVPGIVAAIKDDDSLDITEIAMKALSRIGAAGISALAEFLDEHEDVRRRRRAAGVLSSCEGPIANDAVGRALQDQSIDVRMAAARGVAAINPADQRLAILLVDQDPGVRAQGVELCGAYHPQRLDLLLDDKDLGVQTAVLQMLADHPEITDIPMLDERVRDLLHRSSTSVAAAAAILMGAVSSQDTVSELTEFLGDENLPAEVRRGALKGLKRHAGQDALQSLTSVLDGPDRQIRLEALGAIAELAEQSDWPNAAGDILLSALSGQLVPAPQDDPEEDTTQDEQKTDRPEEAEGESQAAADTGTEVETETEAELETDSETDVAQVEQPEEDQFPTSTLQSIIGGFQSKEVGPPPEDVEMTPEDLEFLSLTGQENKGRRTIPVVPDVNPHEDVRLFAARLLGNFAHADATLALVDALSSSDPELKQTAIDSLAHIAAGQMDFPVQVLDALQEEIKSSNRDIRRQAARALGCAKNPSVAMFLINALDDEDSFVRTEAIHSLGRLGEAGAGVGRLLEDSDAVVRLAAAQALAKTDGPGVIEALVDFSFSFEGYHGRDAARLLCGLDKDAANGLYIQTLTNKEHKRYWKVAIEGLEELNCA